MSTDRKADGLLYKCPAKFKSRELDGLRDAYHWSLSTRSINLHVRKDSLIWDNGTILFNEILSASLKKKGGFWMRRYHLNVKTNSGEYCFEVKPSRFWKQDLPFEASLS